MVGREVKRLVSQSVIDASDALLARIDAKKRLKRKVSGEVVEVEVIPKPKVKRVKKPLTLAARKRKSDKTEDRRLTIENDQILRALAIMRDGRCVIPDCPHPLDGLQMSHIYAKEQKMFPWMRWLLPNVEMRCVWHHKWSPDSPHNGAAKFREWLNRLPTWRTEYLELEANNKRDGKSLEFKRSENGLLRAQFFTTTGNKWGE